MQSGRALQGWIHLYRPGWRWSRYAWTEGWVVLLVHRARLSRHLSDLSVCFSFNNRMSRLQRRLHLWRSLEIVWCILNTTLCCATVEHLVRLPTCNRFMSWIWNSDFLVHTSSLVSCQKKFLIGLSSCTLARYLGSVECALYSSPLQDMSSSV